MSAASAAQIGAIHALKAKAGLDDESYRDFLERETGSRSAKGLSIAAAIQVIDALKAMAGQAAKAKGALQLSGPYAGICRALWISGYELGVFEHREDLALAAFVRRQTGLDSPNWLRDSEPAARVIEALKAWMAREAGVKWPGRRATPSQLKQAVIFAQQRLIGEAQCVVQGDLDLAIRQLGVRVRALSRPS